MRRFLFCQNLGGVLPPAPPASANNCHDPVYATNIKYSMKVPRYLYNALIVGIKVYIPTVMTLYIYLAFDSV